MAGTSKSLIFDGGGNFGLNATKQIVQLFLSQKNQILALYIHSLENNSHTFLEDLLAKWIDDRKYSVIMNPLGSFSIHDWWERMKRIRNLEKFIHVPLEFHQFKEVIAYYIFIRRRF